MNSIGASPSFDVFQYEYVVSVLETTVQFDPAVPESDRRALIREGIKSAATHASFDDKGLKQALSAAQRAYLRQPVRRYRILSSVWLEGSVLPKAVQYSGVELQFSAVGTFSCDRSPVADRIATLLAPLLEEPPTKIHTRVTARTCSAALSSFRDGADYIRASWNYVINCRTRPLFHFGRPRPVNRILLGPVHTVHNDDGSLADTSFWHEPQPIRPEWLYRTDRTWTDVQNAAIRLRRHVRGSHYRDDLVHALMQYGRALDWPDPEISFIGLWSVLELLTNSEGRYEQLVRRVCFLPKDEDRAFVRLLVEHLRDVRNGIIHRNAGRANITTYLYQLKSVVEMAMQFHIRNRPRFSSRAEAAEYLDLPVDRSLLRERIRLYRRASTAERW